MAQSIYRRLLGVECPVDIIVVTPGDIKQYRDDHCLVIKPALDKGRIVYEKKTI
jgi:signal peptidase I